MSKKNKKKKKHFLSSNLCFLYYIGISITTAIWKPFELAMLETLTVKPASIKPSHFLTCRKAPTPTFVLQCRLAKCATSRHPGGWRRRKRINWKIRCSACAQFFAWTLLSPSLLLLAKLPSSSPANECQSPFRMTRRRWSHDSRITASGLIKVYINKSVSYANPNHAEAAETITTDETTGRGAVGHLFLTSSCLSNFLFFFPLRGKKHWIIPFGTALASYLRAPSLGLARIQRQSVRACPVFING